VVQRENASNRDPSKGKVTTSEPPTAGRGNLRPGGNKMGKKCAYGSTIEKRKETAYEAAKKKRGERNSLVGKDCS